MNHELGFDIKIQAFKINSSFSFLINSGEDAFTLDMSGKGYKYSCGNELYNKDFEDDDYDDYDDYDEDNEY